MLELDLGFAFYGDLELTVYVVADVELFQLRIEVDELVVSDQFAREDGACLAILFRRLGVPDSQDHASSFFLHVFSVNVNGIGIRRLILHQKLLHRLDAVSLVMRGGGIQPNSDIIGRDNQSKVDVLVVVEVDFFYLDDEEVSLYAGLIEGDVAFDGFHLCCFVGDGDAHGVQR